MAQQMKLTLGVINADVGSVAGHDRPHPDLLKQAEEGLAFGGEERALPYLAALDQEGER